LPFSFTFRIFLAWFLSMEFRPVILVLVFLLWWFCSTRRRSCRKEQAREIQERTGERDTGESARKLRKTTDEREDKRDSEKRRNDTPTPNNLLPLHSYSPCRYFESPKTYMYVERKRIKKSPRRDVEIIFALTKSQPEV